MSIFPNKWWTLNEVRTALNWYWDNWVVRPFKSLKSGFQGFLRVLWDLPATAKGFGESITRGMEFWYRKGRDLIAPIARGIFNLLITPWRPLLDLWNNYGRRILDFFRDPIGHIEVWIRGLGELIFELVARALGTDKAALRRRWRTLVEFLDTLWIRIRDFFTKTLPDWWDSITLWIGNFVRLSRDSKGFFLSFIHDPWGTLQIVVRALLERLGKQIYIIVLEFIDRRW